MKHAKKILAFASLTVALGIFLATSVTHAQEPSPAESRQKWKHRRQRRRPRPPKRRKKILALRRRSLPKDYSSRSAAPRWRWTPCGR